MMEAKSLAYVDTIYSADSIEFCPWEGYQDLFICGTYQIVKPEEAPPPPAPPLKNAEDDDADSDSDSDSMEEYGGPSKPTERVGRILLFQVGEDGESFEELQRIETPAILDTKWSPHLQGGRPSLGVADAKGHITIYLLDTETRRLEEQQRTDVDDDTTLCLSLDYSHRLHPSTQPSIITSLSTGSLAHLVPSETGYEVSSTFHAHDYEPWITTFDLWDTNIVWSGGDDCKLKRWDLRETSRPTLVNKNFEAGVTTITPSPHTEHLLAVGSYDESLRIFDARSPRQPLTTLQLGGGIWRTRFHPSPSRKGDILVACMHDGFKVVRLDDPESLLNPSIDTQENVDVGGVVRSFKGHESLAYGTDWCRLPPKDQQMGESLVVSCSFYDHAMHLWRG
ncbi:hypothetical protein CI109_101068 [Kwoniella shandongensis]|uniref:methylated diphthine methylhydrolase n=1 Tax=Kwoniella shandongensis TaxID=1734106 RepID=A0A5M6C5S4_9TREE|nr:uncharacterized protein CI109_001537 [Kwoniella shandongensis]KAA5530131.1 hypothetical protein CI109_001537 [Kwoniella shandongensis]